MEVNKENGQALLVVVLVMVVALTVGLSLTSRSIVNIRTSTEEADSQKALAAAEAGIEQALQEYNTATIAGPFIENKTTYSTAITAVGGNSILVNGGNLVAQDDGIDIWLVPHNADGKPDYSTSWGNNDKLDIYWGDPALNDHCGNAAIEVAVISGTQAAPVLKRYAYDPCNSRQGANKFSNVPGGGPYSFQGKGFKYNVQINIKDGLIARVVPIYTSTAIAVKGSILLPTQGFKIDSTGTSGAPDREVKRSLTFFRTYDELPTPYFMYGLFSP